MSVVYINGRFEREEDARISPFNRGLLYGDGLFETMRGYGGKVFALEGHLERLKQSADYLRLSVPFDAAGLRGILCELLVANDLSEGDSRIRVNLTRGEGRRGLVGEEWGVPEVIITAEGVSAEIGRIQREGLGLVIIRGHRVDQNSPLACHKTFNYMPGVMGLMEVRKKGGDEGLFLNYDGNVVEGVTSNIFMVRDGHLVTPPLSSGLLPGITRKTVISVAGEEEIHLEERDITEEDLCRADELFITSSVREVVPVITLDSTRFYVGPLTRHMQAAYKRHVTDSFE